MEASDKRSALSADEDQVQGWHEVVVMFVRQEGLVPFNIYDISRSCMITKARIKVLSQRIGRDGIFHNICLFTWNLQFCLRLPLITSPQFKGTLSNPPQSGRLSTVNK